MNNEKQKSYSRKVKLTAVMLLNIFILQLMYPNLSLALTSGPSQPEVQGFEPVGTTDMVDMFSGSFVYNIPLLDIEGYPVNISYHGGITMEQESSWVGLGWNINPGVINRSIRGIPDDFNGDTVYKDLNIEPEKTWRIGVGVGGELAGVGDPIVNASYSLGANVNISNYRGVSCDFSTGGGINVFHAVSVGVNIGIGSQTGSSIDLNAGLSLGSAMGLSKGAAQLGLNAAIGGGYNSRSGVVKDASIGAGLSMGSASYSSSYHVPIGLQNYVPVITNSSSMKSIYGRLKMGLEGFSVFGYANVSAMASKLTFNNDGSRPAYGYLYLQNANLKDEDILDFTRDKDGMFNKSMQYLPLPSMTYDVYNVSGQGTGGMFRPFRNDFGCVYDPLTTSNVNSTSGQMEGAVGNWFEYGLDLSNMYTEISSGPWLKQIRKGEVKGYQKKQNGSVYENVYFKQAGEMTAVDSTYYQIIGKTDPIKPDVAMGLPSKKPNSDSKRDARGNVIYYHTATEASASGVAAEPSITSYSDLAHIHSGDAAYTSTIPRIGTNVFQRKKDQISEIVQVQKDGRKYVYGIPALNNIQRESSFSVDPTSPENVLNLGTGIISFSNTDASHDNNKGLDHYYNSTITSSCAHSYLLTSVLSNDYVDVNGDGVTDDDLGSFTRFHYCRTDSDYRWIAPYSKTFKNAQYNPGFWSDKKDDKANFICGSREQWYMHSIESKNYIAEFYISQRNDGLGITTPIYGSSLLYKSAKTSPSLSYKLDSIKLYNKHDRFVNGLAAVSIKGIYFEYDYSLCSGVPNTLSGSGGKLTLKRIYFGNGKSRKSMISPYQFSYGYNPAYALENKDRWGNYKPNSVSFTNYEFPYVNQIDPSNDIYASAWSLEKISLPSGGTIKATYESNDYAYVQDKPVNEMFMVKGLGTTPDYSTGTQLYIDRNSPCLYAYFLRRPGNELASLTIAQNYMGRDFEKDGQNCVYFNFNVRLTNSNATFEQIKGYGNVLDVGKCPNNPQYGYIKFEKVVPTGTGGIPLSTAAIISDITTGSGCYLNPVTFTGLNTGRYNLPQVIYPGQNPDESNFKNILAGLKGAFDELLNFGRNPIMRLVEKGGGQKVNLAKSYIRLHSVGMKKKGGGQRVKTLTFSDEWDLMAGVNEQKATYGKQYSYKTQCSGFGEISSGVASYEPLAGGDENPLRQPVKYTAKSSNKWPPIDPVDLYQETPIGESLYPPGQVGYSEVQVTSLNINQGRSSKAIDKYEFYTAKDYPARFIATSIDPEIKNKYTFFSQINSMKATQGYTLIFNDMHGKPKRVEHDMVNMTTGILTPINYQIFKYKEKDNMLDNKVDCFVYNGSNMEIKSIQLGLEEDLTFDSREKIDYTTNSSANGNLNVFILPLFIPVPVVLPYGFGWGSTSQTIFQSAVVTKVIQQYGIIDNIESLNENAKTVVRNEIFDPVTGQAVVTSVNNEFEDKEYTTNIPAWWVYNGMSGAYNNIGFKDYGTISVSSNFIGKLNITNSTPLMPGDYLSIWYKVPGVAVYHTTGWVLGKIPEYSESGESDCDGVRVLPHFPKNTPGWNAGTTLDSVTIRVISSGRKNMLEQSAMTYTSLEHPTYGGATLSDNLSSIIDIKGYTFSDSNTRTIPKFIANPDTVNPYAIGERGAWRLLSEYSYHTDRRYSGHTSRTAGLFSASSLFSGHTGTELPCGYDPFNFLHQNSNDPNWRATRTVTKWSPYGQEIENIDAIGIYSTAVFSYNDALPVAVATNARQGEVLSLGFEDFYLLKQERDVLNYNYFPPVFNGTGSLYTPILGYKMSLPRNNVYVSDGHTGMQSYYSNLNDVFLDVPIQEDDLSVGTNKYNGYFSSSPTAPYHFTPNNAYLNFALRKGHSYILSYWIKADSKGAKNLVDYTFSSPGLPSMRTFSAGIPFDNFAVKKTNIIDGWQQLEAEFTVPVDATGATIVLPPGFYVDDLRIYPSISNVKTFVYGPVNSAFRATNEQLIATLDENNFATFYEYDNEGKLVRTKKEAAKGIMTISESRSGNPKK